MTMTPSTERPALSPGRGLVAAVGLALLLSSCGLLPEKPAPVEELSAAEIFARGEAQLDAGDEIAAARTFNEIERLYPFSQLAKRAIIMSAFASYEAGDFPSTRAQASRYLDLYPADADAAYAQYLIALSYYDNIVDVGRDQEVTRNALNELTTVVNRYPDSDYARDSQLKIDLTRDHLAGKEMSVGRYYLKRGFYSAAISRFRTVIDEYDTTSQTPEALHRLVEAYLALGLIEEARASAIVLGENYPGSGWYSDSYAALTGIEVVEKEDDGGTLSSLYRQIILGRWL
ncbi:MAG: outer membrane protein assembly factor BamD [Pseudomonadota bacterium]